MAGSPPHLADSIWLVGSDSLRDRGYYLRELQGTASVAVWTLDHLAYSLCQASTPSSTLAKRAVGLRHGLPPL